MQRKRLRLHPHISPQRGLSVCRLSSVVCHIRAPCLNRSTDLDAIWQVHLWGPMTHCVRWGSLTTRGKKIWRSNPQPQHAIAKCFCHRANRNEDQFRVLPNYFGTCFNLLTHSQKTTQQGKTENNRRLSE